MPKVDNYIKFLNAFYAWEQKNPLTPIQECILMRILRHVNASGWCEWVKISNSELINELRISCKNTFVNNRNRLMELGLIQYKAGKKGKPSNYKLNMPQKKEIIYSFGKKENIKEKGMIDIPNNIPKNNKDDKKGIINIPKSIPNNIPYFIPNNPETSHEQCVPEPPKHKTINNKHNITRINTRNIITVAQSDKITHELLEEPDEKIFIEIPLIGDKVYRMPESLVDEYQKLYTGIDVRQEIREYKAWTLSNPNKRKTERGILRSINCWLEKNQNSGNKKPSNGVNRDGKASYDIEGYHNFCRNNLMSSKPTDAFSETLDEQEKLEFIEVEVT